MHQVEELLVSTLHCAKYEFSKRSPVYLSHPICDTQVMKLVIANVVPIYLSVAEVVTSLGTKHHQSDHQQLDLDH